MASFGDAVGGFAAMPSGSGAVNEFRNGWRYDGHSWQPPAGYTDAIGGNGGAGGNSDPLALAKAAQQLQIQANQPAIQTLQGQQQSLKDQYSSLLASVLNQGTVASNYAQRAENTLLGQRGIVDPNSAFYGQQMTQALLPVTAQNQSAAANVGAGSAQDLNALAAQIAAFQAGNVPNALTFGGQISGQQTALQQAIQAAQIQGSAQVAAAQAQPKYVTYPNTGLFNTQNGQNVLPTFG